MTLPNFLVWPVCVLTPRDIAATPSGTSAIFGGRNMAGGARAAQWSAGGLWRLIYEDIFIDSREQVLCAQALDALLDGGATEIIVPRMPGRQAPDGAMPEVPHSDESFFEDASGYISDGSDGTVAVGALMGDTTLIVDRPVNAGRLLGGEDFSLWTEGQANIPDGPRLHRGARILAEEVVGDSRRYTLEIRTPLRADVAPLTPTNYTNPAGLMRLTNYDDFVALLRRHKSAIFSAHFAEV